MGDAPWRPNDLWDPSNPDNRDRTRLLTAQLRDRLLTWDPIGVADNPEAWAEYDCLISPLMHRLSDSVSSRKLAKWLVAELQDHFGLRPDRSRERALANDLTQWWAEATANA